MFGDRRTSVRVRVTVGATAVLALALLITALTVAGLLRGSIERDSTNLLLDRVDAVESLVVSDALPEVLEPTGREVGQVQVLDQNGVVVSRTPGLGTATRLDVVDAPPVGQQVVTQVDGAGIDNDPNERYQAIARTVPTASGPVTIYAVTSLTPGVRAEEYLRTRLLLGLPLLVIVAAIVIYRVVGRALAPVDAMRVEVDRIEATDLSGRVTPASSDDEIASLGATLNHMLDRLEHSAAQQRLFAAAASHELRSPLSAIRTELEVGLAYPDLTDWPTTAGNSLIEIERLEHLARDLRMLTNSAQASRSGMEQMDLGEVVGAELLRRSQTTGIAYQREIGSGIIVGDRNAVLQVVRNLLDNAERHAAADVSVRVARVGDAVELWVSNDGPAIPPDMREEVFEPFMRLDEARSIDGGGSGLGLAIVRAIMTTHGGSIRVADEIHGSRFVASFPAVSQG